MRLAFTLEYDGTNFSGFQRQINASTIQEHIENAIFFDIDKFSNKKTELPHMLPNEKEWEKIVSNLGILK